MEIAIEKKIVRFYDILSSGGNEDLSSRIREDEPMRRHTTMRVGGPADLFVEPAGLLEVASLYNAAKKCGLPCFVIGNGSNLVVSDEGIEGLVISLGEPLSKIWFEDDADDADFVLVHAFSGALLSRVAMVCAKRGLTGMEFASGIPGSIGGAVYMNAGAYGSQMSDIVYRSVFLTSEGDLRTITGAEHAYGYRTSFFTSHEGVILSSILRLPTGDPKTIMDRIMELNGKRSAAQPISMPSAGSVFKRPQGHFAGALIEAAGLKGTSVGGAQVSEKHAGFIVNTGSATAKDVYDLVKMVRETVKRHAGVVLEPEIKFVGRGFN